jgi:glycosyltransferase involved in cell wall biosynthesis
VTIFVDLLSLGYGGSETYPLEVLPRIAATNHGLSVLLRAGDGALLRSKLPSSVDVIEAPTSTRNPLVRYAYQASEVPKLMRSRGAKVLFVPGGLTGSWPNASAGTKLVVMLRNMLPVLARERSRFTFRHYPWVRLRLCLLGQGLKATFQKASRIIFISQHSANVVGPRFPSKDKVVIPHGVSLHFVPSETVERRILDSYNIRKPYFLYVSLFDPYKHQLVVMRAFQEYIKLSKAGNFQLVLAGTSQGHYGKEVLNLTRTVGNSIVCPGGIPREHLPALLRNAEILMFGSTCEACPNTLLEYLAAGRPILCSDSLPMPEFGGNAVFYAKAEDTKSWATGISQLMADEPLRQSLARMALEKSRAYTWDVTVQQTIKALTEW